MKSQRFCDDGCHPVDIQCALRLTGGPPDLIYMYPFCASRNDHIYYSTTLIMSKSTVLSYNHKPIVDQGK